MKRLAMIIVTSMTVSAALAASFVHGDPGHSTELQNAAHAQTLPTPEQIAVWKATATIADYTPPSPPR